MNYTFAPFRMGVENISQEEMKMISEHSKAVVDKMYGLGVFHALVAAEKVLRHSANGLNIAAEALQAASNKVADVHQRVVTELSYIKEGEVLGPQLVKDCDGQVA